MKEKKKQGATHGERKEDEKNKRFTKGKKLKKEKK